MFCIGGRNLRPPMGGAALSPACKGGAAAKEGYPPENPANTRKGGNAVRGRAKQMGGGLLPWPGAGKIKMGQPTPGQTRMGHLAPRPPPAKLE